MKISGNPCRAHISLSLHTIAVDIVEYMMCVLNYFDVIIIIIKCICIAPESIVLLSGASHNVQIVAKIKLLLK